LSCVDDNINNELKSKAMMYFINNIYIRIVLCGFFTWFATKANAQSKIESDTLEIAYNRTSSIVFPAVIKSVDKGSRDILAQKAKGVGNVLQLKAGRERFAQTNLTVITADGVLHHFTVNYSEQPLNLTVLTGSGHDTPSSSLVFQTELTQTDMENFSSGIVSDKRRVRSVHESGNKMSLTLMGIYIKGDAMFYRFRIVNHSNIDYDIDFLKFYIRDKARIKRTASQEVEVRPIYVYGNDKKVHGNSSTEIVFALQKLTIPESKYLQVELFEKNGGRHLNVDIKNKTIVNARLLE
jgi:conjugative transposon TraN protein